MYFFLLKPLQNKKLQLLIFFTLVLLYGLNFYKATLPNTKKTSGDSRQHNDFYVLTSYFNPVGYESRLRLYKRFVEHMSQFNIHLVTIELAYKDQPFQVTDPGNPNHIQLRTDFVIWYKENLLNIAFKRLPKSCKYVAWIDGDVELTNDNWVVETKDALEVFKIVQLFQYANFLGPNNEVLQKDAGYGYYFATNKPYRISWSPYKAFHANGTEKISLDSNETHCYWHSGFGWAAQRTTLLDMGGLLEIGILGGGDFMMSYAYINKAKGGIPLYNNTEFIDEIYRWSAQIQPHIKQKVGYVRGEMNHFWHGSIENRQYQARDRILHGGEIMFSPRKHMYHDSQTSLIRLTDDFRVYLANKTEIFYKNRKEDE